MKFSQAYSSSPSLTLNVLEIVTTKTDVEVLKSKYKDHMQKRYLEQKNPDYFFYREGSDLYAWSRTFNPKTELSNEFTRATITKDSNTLVYLKILEESFVTFFKPTDRLRKLRYSSTWELRLKDQSKSFGDLNVHTTLNFSFHPFFSNKGRGSNRISALSLSLSQKYVFEADEATLNSKGIDTRNWTRNDRKEITASYANARNYLSAIGKLTQFDDHKSRGSSSKYQYAQLIDFTARIKRDALPKLFLPDSLRISDLALYNLPNSHFDSDKIDKPRYYYYQDRTASTFYNVAVKNQFPYSHDAFKSKHLKVLVLTPEAHALTTGEFLPKLENVLRSTFHIPSITFHVCEVRLPSQTYVEAIDSIDVSHENPEIAIVVVSQNDKILPTRTSPYYTAKAKLLNQRIPSQEITVEVMRRANATSQNGELLREAIALNIYSKIGGTAWAIQKTQKQKVEVILGIGSVLDPFKDRVIGFASVFDYNGNYLVGDCSHLSTTANYADNLRDYLVDNIKYVIRLNNLEKGAEFNLIFHLTKEASREYEIRAIEAAVSKFPEYNIRFGIVHVSFNHNLRMYCDEGGVEVPRGTFVQVSTLQALLHFGNRTTSPALIRLDKRSDFKDIYDISKQILSFSHLSYRSFRPANVPITMKYPALMAKLTSELMQVPKWDNSQLNHIKDLLWFI